MILIINIFYKSNLFHQELIKSRCVIFDNGRAEGPMWLKPIYIYTHTHMQAILGAYRFVQFGSIEIAWA